MVRASGVFNSISDFSVAVVALTRESCELKAIRLKDRVTYPLANGYRDVLVNFLMEGCDLILELQLVSNARYTLGIGITLTPHPTLTPHHPTTLPPTALRRHHCY